MGTFQDGILGALRSTTCSLFQGSEAFGNKFGRVFPPAKLTAKLSGFVAGLVCDRDPDTYPPFVSPPFQGGQCATSYDVTAEFRRVNENNGNESLVSDTVTVTGPIRGLRLERIDAPEFFFPTDRWNFYVLNAGADRLIRSETFRRDRDGGLFDERISQIVRRDGQPDDCGDPAGTIGPDSPITVPDVPVTWTDPDGVEHTVPYDITYYSPYILNDNSLNVTVKVDELFGDLEIFPDFRFSPRIGFGGNGSPSPLCGEETPVPEEEAPEVPEEFNPRILGVWVLSNPSGTDRTTNVFQPNAPDIHVPRVAQVFFGFSVNFSSGWLVPIDVVTRRAYIPCPIPEGVRNVRVVWTDGWSGTFQRNYEAPPAPEDELTFDVCGLTITPNIPG